MRKLVQFAKGGIPLAHPTGSYVPQGKTLDLLPTANTVFAVVVRTLQLDLPIPLVMAVTLACVCGWILIAVEIRRSTRRTNLKNTGESELSKAAHLQELL